MAQDRRRQKKIERHKKKRQQAQRKTRTASHRPPPDLVRRAAQGDFGPAYIGQDWQRETAGVPNLVTVVLTRRLPSGQLLPVTALVNRTCLGVKNGFVMKPCAEWELPALVQRAGRAHGGMIPCEPLVAQSVVFHAVDYARSLGFSPHPDVPLEFFGPRPPQLAETPFAHPERPCYFAGPRDDAGRIMATLEKAVGPGNFHFFAPLPMGSAPPFAIEDGDWDEEEDEDTIDMVDEGDARLEEHRD